tara:strand:- start:170 stop:598 length:429 start_codon:yes stop_codon:yes gene_type:complete
MSDSNDHFIIPVKYYVGTLLSLIFLSIVTVLVVLVDLGPLNIYVAMFIAILKATLVVSVFMGLYWDEAFNRIIFVGAIAFSLLFLVFTLLDVDTRPDVFSNEGKYFDIDSPVNLVEEYSSHGHNASHLDDVTHDDTELKSTH